MSGSAQTMVIPPGPVVLPASLASVAAAAPASLLDTVVAAVDPLEIAAALETCGMSNGVVRDQFGRRDVFELADELYAAVPLRPAPTADRRTYRRGQPVDLGRGVVFAAPTLMFAGAALALRSWLSWWSVPLALICGWACSQAVAYVGFSRQAYREQRSPILVWALAAAVAICAGAGLAGDTLVGGRFSGALFAAAAAAFMTAAAELIAHAEEHLIGLVLLPGAAGSIIYITREPFVMPVRGAVALAAASVIGTVIIALRHVPARWWGLPVANRAELSTLARFFASGLCCGVFVALFMVLEPARGGISSWPAVAMYPMMLSLGAMEWQLRTFRAAARDALLSSRTSASFARSARRQLARTMACYLLVLLSLTGAVLALAAVKDVPVPTLLVVAGTALALAFFLALVVAACGRVDISLRTWVLGIAVYGAWGVYTRASSPRWPLPDARLAFCVAAVATAATFIVIAVRTVTNPVCHG